MSGVLRMAIVGLAVALLPTLPGYLRRSTTVPLLGVAQLPSSIAREYRAIGFDQLASFPSDTPGGSGPRIPDAILALDGERVAIRGYVIPIAYEGAGVTQLLLAVRNDLGCCFGVGMRPTEWVFVRWAGPSLVSPTQSAPVTVLGRFEVRPDLSDGALEAIYRMVGERILQ